MSLHARIQPACPPAWLATLELILLPGYLLAQPRTERTAKNQAPADGTEQPLDEALIKEQPTDSIPELTVKLDKLEIMDSASSEEMAKRPAPNAAEALSRVSGSEFGVLQGVSRQKRAWCEDPTSAGHPTTRTHIASRYDNLTGLYDKGRWSARWPHERRPRYIASVATCRGVGSMPICVNAYGWLDASVGCRLNDRVAFSLQGHNRIGTIRASAATRPHSASLNDIQTSAAMTAHF